MNVYRPLALDFTVADAKENRFVTNVTETNAGMAIGVEIESWLDDGISI
jgi:hypothetical protein